MRDRDGSERAERHERDSGPGCERNDDRVNLGDRRLRLDATGICARQIPSPPFLWRTLFGCTRKRSVSTQRAPQEINIYTTETIWMY